MNYKKFLLSVMFDFSKAFDAVNHALHGSDINHLGFRGITNNRLKSDLNNTQQYDYFYCDVSSELSLGQMGVPQGSLLGFLLFLICIMICPNARPMFNFYTADFDLVNLRTSVNDVISKADQWLRTNRLSSNVTKTFYLTMPNKNNSYGPSNKNQGNGY